MQDNTSGIFIVMRFWISKGLERRLLRQITVNRRTNRVMDEQTDRRKNKLRLNRQTDSAK